ncbi:MAG TPA: SCO family protein [Chthoniobacterales bacterium]|jgi:Uncharacterized protein SCO1/SenC/PrrC, involved in biogenesis of respiratory and photosynthetic systems|nr:SCO family protein [Chthoniobacterales bacterium]
MENFTARYLASVPALCIALALAACDPSHKSDTGPRHYEARGIVRGFAPDHSTVDVEHETIPGFMPSMMMPFTARDAKEIANLRSGDAISFRVEVTDNDVWIANVKKIALDEVHLPKPTATPPPYIASRRLREGEVMPAFQLTSANGETIKPDTFRGRQWILTFVFTRCPMPNFCPRMAKNFLELQDAIKTGSGALGETRLLSITIDPEYDTPAVLKEYAEHAGADPKIWTFATGVVPQIEGLKESFAVYTEREGGSISHGLTTALVDRDGKVLKLWRGNAWTPREVLESLNGNADASHITTEEDEPAR